MSSIKSLENAPCFNCGEIGPSVLFSNNMSADYNSSDIDSNESEKYTPFRKLFKFYKRREGNVDLSKVIDLRVSNASTNGINCVPLKVQQVRNFGDIVKKNWRTQRYRSVDRNHDCTQARSIYFERYFSS